MGQQERRASMEKAVRSLLDSDTISLGRAAELLGLSLQEMRELSKKWWREDGDEDD